MHEYGTSRRELAEICVQLRNNGIAHGGGLMTTPLSVEDCLSARPISTPYHLYDCSPIADGGAALLVTGADVARSYGARAVKVIGFGAAYWAEHSWCAKSLTESAARESGERAYAMAGCGPSEITAAEIYDCFSGAFMIQLADLGFCKKGEEAGFIAEGGLAGARGTRFNTNGGLLSYGHTGIAAGLSLVVEGVRQARMAKAAQKGKVQVGKVLVHNMGGIFSSHATIVLEGGY
jgi:acetyl-CoA acetyltransferase